MAFHAGCGIITLIKYALGKCVMCGAAADVRRVLHRPAPNIKPIEVEAEVCRVCGEKAFDGDTVEMFEKLRRADRGL